jgi:hypothetical protein
MCTILNTTRSSQLCATVLGRQGRQKIISPKIAGKIIKFIKYFVKIKKMKSTKIVDKKTKENV